MVERGLRENHQGAPVRIESTNATAKVTSLELPVFISFPDASFDPKAGDALELLLKPDDDLPARIA
ncbi:hypothetical protein D7W79_28410 [Corallococcus exercitus]|nr:hypothetical protein D7W79_28410 [Corallococcus exercitus]